MFTTCEETHPIQQRIPARHIDKCWVVPQSPNALTTVRQDVRGSLETCEVGADAMDNTVLVVSELITNSVSYALPPITLRVTVRGDGVVHIEVVDAGAAPAVGDLDTRPADERGRGNLIVSMLADRSGRTVDEDKVIWWADVPVD
ncbi:ATP-binding protein [Streptomyces parvulus]|uniref:ATP-binding protein n=1 Tax=Streptomyces parvulus TaxID=146923 RepID=A0A369UX81_9ACTN|nr:ATP-binding protein [Streptomyces parvulus]